MNQPLKFNKVKFRSSGAGYLMTEPRSKSPKVQYQELLESIKTTYSSTIESINECVGATTPAKIKAQEAKIEKLKIKGKEKIIELINQAIILFPSIDKIHLSDTCISVLLKIYIEQKSGRRDEIKSRYLQKGTQSESNSFDLLAEYDEVFAHEKNTERLFNDWIQGECDLLEETRITDIKSSWDIFTFTPKTIETELDKIYWWQGQCYMWLYGVERFRLAYVLSNTPQGIIDDEKKRFLWELGSNKADSEAYKLGCAEIEHNSIYDDLSVKERVYCLPDITLDLEKIEALKSRVEECRNWLNWYAKKEYNRVNNIVESVEEKMIDFDGVLSECELSLAHINFVSEETFEKIKTLKQIDSLNLYVIENESIGFIPDHAFINPVQINLEDSIAEIKAEKQVTTSFFDEDEPQTGEILISKIKNDVNSCKTIEDLRTLFSSIELEFPEYLTQDIRQEFGNKENEISKYSTPIIKEEVISTTITEVNDVVSELSDEWIASSIKDCVTVEDCNTLYPKIKHRTEFVDVLRKKKLKLQNPEPTYQPEPKPKKEAVERKNNDIYLLVSTFTEPNEVIDYYTSNQEVIDADDDLMKFMEKTGIELERKKRANV